MNKGPAAKEFACPGQNDKDITVNFTFVFQTSDTIVVKDEAQIFLFFFCGEVFNFMSMWNYSDLKDTI